MIVLVCQISEKFDNDLPILNSYTYYLIVFIQNFMVFGYARTKMTDDELRNMISRTLTCRIDKWYYIAKPSFTCKNIFLFFVL